MSIKYSVNDYVSVFIENYTTKNKFNFSIGQIISIANNNYRIKLINNNEIVCNIVIFDFITILFPSTSKFEIRNKDDEFDLINCSKIDVKNIQLYIYEKIKEGNNNYMLFLTHLPNSNLVKHISKCSHGKECERLGCPKGPEYCPHGKGCERMVCKAMY